MPDTLRPLRERLESAMLSVQLWLGLLVFLPVAALLLASGTELPTGKLFADLLIWGLGLLFCGWLLLRLAPVLRRRHIGDMPPRQPVTRQDVLVHAVCLLIGPMLLFWFVPRLLELHPESLGELLSELRRRWADGLLVGIGAWLSLRPCIALFNYITRP
ncbi:MAG: hypothetical protein JNJ46_13540 [Myxococcales bacterium]|nr:hypothetical protein [Myxococcales bacterium]